MTTAVDLAAVLRGDDPLTAGEYRRALDAMTAEGYVFVRAAELVDLAAARPDDGSIAHRVVILARLLDDPTLLASLLVDAISRDLATERAA